MTQQNIHFYYTFNEKTDKSTRDFFTVKNENVFYQLNIQKEPIDVETIQNEIYLQKGFCRDDENKTATLIYAFKRTLYLPSFLVYMRNKNQIIGATIIKIKNNDELYIDYICTPVNTNKYGNMLIKTLKNIMYRLNLTKITLYSVKASVGFYKKMGFYVDNDIRPRIYYENENRNSSMDYMVFDNKYYHLRSSQKIIQNVKDENEFFNQPKQRFSSSSSKSRKRTSMTRTSTQKNKKFGISSIKE